MTAEKPTQSNPTLKQIAAASGVSAMTVSRAFREGTSVRKDVRDRILQEAERLGYQPNPMLSALMSSLAGRKGAQYRDDRSHLVEVDLAVSAGPWFLG